MIGFIHTIRKWKITTLSKDGNGFKVFCLMFKVDNLKMPPLNLNKTKCTFYELFETDSFEYINPFWI